MPARCSRPDGHRRSRDRGDVNQLCLGRDVAAVLGLRRALAGCATSEPRVGAHGLGSRPGRGRAVQQPQRQLGCGVACWQPVRLGVGWPRSHHANHLRLRVSSEREAACQHEVKANAQGPHVCGPRVMGVAAHQRLGSHVHQRTSGLCDSLRRGRRGRRCRQGRGRGCGEPLRCRGRPTDKPQRPCRCASRDRAPAWRRGPAVALAYAPLAVGAKGGAGEKLLVGKRLRQLGRGCHRRPGSRPEWVGAAGGRGGLVIGRCCPHGRKRRDQSSGGRLPRRAR
mmetsp:Transcript_18664/g.70901  ORF Transcript_18664/g.70901 Transcript_18664/m.70901 type:complete len:281 (-) Transcript_18664:1287-2129(-)